MLFIDAGLPTPTTQIPVFDERDQSVWTLNMGWEDYMVGAAFHLRFAETVFQQTNCEKGCAGIPFRPKGAVK